MVEDGGDDARAVLLAIAARMKAQARGHPDEGMIEGFAGEMRTARARPAAAAPAGALSAAMGAAKDTELAERVVALSRRGELRWRAPSRLPDAGTRVAICALGDRFELRAYTAGLMYLDPHEAYPPHAHAPAEFYLVLSGTADWRFGGAGEYRPVEPGSVL